MERTGLTDQSLPMTEWRGTYGYGENRVRPALLLNKIGINQTGAREPTGRSAQSSRRMDVHASRPP